MSYKKIDPKVKRKWVKALRSGRYKQGQKRLRLDDSKKTTYCCIGVLLKTMRAKWNGDYADFVKVNGEGVEIKSYDQPPFDFWEALGSNHRVGDRLVRLNDIEGWDFKQIADWVEKNV